MLVINFLQYLAILVLVISSMVFFLNSAKTERKSQDRLFDLVAGALLIILFMVLLYVFALVEGGIVQ